MNVLLKLQLCRARSRCLDSRRHVKICTRAYVSRSYDLRCAHHPLLFPLCLIKTSPEAAQRLSLGVGGVFFHMSATVTIAILPHRTTMDPLCDAHLPSMLVALRLGKGRVEQGGGEQPPGRPTSDPAAAFADTSLDFNLRAQQSGLKTALLTQTGLKLNANASLTP